MNLTAEELRVLCVLVEKSFTTPDQYPMTTNSLVIGCNQRTNRDPVVAYNAGQVDAAMQDLRASGWARTVRTTGSRTNKHKHVVTEQLTVSDAQLALLAVLGLRGAQAPGELKTRTERYVGFESFDDVVAELEAMAAMPEPLVRNIGTRPGQSQDRWIHLLGDVADTKTEAVPASAGFAGPPVASVAGAVGPEAVGTDAVQDAEPGVDGVDTDLAETVRALERTVADLESRIDELEKIWS